MIDWNDYRLLLHIARRGRVAEAADDLGVTASTVFRRLAAIEAGLGTPIFLKEDGRYLPSDEGSALILAAEKMEQETARVSRTLSDPSISGTVTITTTEVLSSFFVARHVGTLLKLHPQLSVRVISSDRALDLSRREADVAIRPRAAIPNFCFGRHLATVRWATYIARDTDVSGSIDAEKQIGFAGDPRLGEFLGPLSSDLGDPKQPSLLGSSKILQAAMCAQSDQLATLPLILGESWPGLKRVGAILEAPIGDFWIVCHQDMRRNPRVRAVFDAMIEGARADRHLFEGA